MTNEFPGLWSKTWTLLKYGYRPWQNAQGTEKRIFHKEVDVAVMRWLVSLSVVRYTDIVSTSVEWVNPGFSSVSGLWTVGIALTDWDLYWHSEQTDRDKVYGLHVGPFWWEWYS